MRTVVVLLGLLLGGCFVQQAQVGRLEVGEVVIPAAGVGEAGGVAFHRRYPHANDRARCLTCHGGIVR